MMSSPVFRALTSDYAYLYLPALADGWLFWATDPHPVDL